MYRIVGADQRIYGPVDARSLRHWIAERRANAETWCSTESAPEWTPLSEFAEFDGDLAAQRLLPAPIPAPPCPAGTGAAQLADEIIARGVEVRIGRSVDRGWILLLENFWLLVGANLLIWLTLLALASFPFATLILGGVLGGGLQWLSLKRLRGETADVGDAFAGFVLAFLPLMLVGILTSILTCFGLLLLLVPGIYLWVAWQFALLLAIDRKLDFWVAMEVSRRVITDRWWSMLGLVIVLFLIDLLGFLLCVVGSFVTAPLTTAALASAYEDIFGEPRPPAAGRPQLTGPGATSPAGAARAPGS